MSVNGTEYSKDTENGLSYPRPNNFMAILDAMKINKSDMVRRGRFSHGTVEKIALGYLPSRTGTKEKTVRALNSLIDDRIRQFRKMRDIAAINKVITAVNSFRTEETKLSLLSDESDISNYRIVLSEHDIWP
jgi:hypothetical protein